MLRHTALKRKTPMARKVIDRARARLRKNAPKAVSRGVKPNARQRRYWDSLPLECVACGRETHRTPHHILADAPGKGSRRDHMLVVRLDPGCHTDNGASVHKLGSEALFFDATGIDLVAIAVRNRDAWEESCER